MALPSALPMEVPGADLVGFSILPFAFAPLGDSFALRPS